MCQFEKNSPGACVKSGFWGAPRRESQSQEDMALLFYLLTCPERSPVGIAQFNWGISAARLKWDRLQLLTVLDRLETQQEIIRSDNWLFVTTWWDHNSLPGPGLEERINALLVEVPKMLVAALIQATKKAYQGSSIWLLKLPILCDELSVGSTGGSTPPTRGSKNNDKRKNKDKSNTTTDAADSGEIGFNTRGGGDFVLEKIELTSDAECYRKNIEFVSQAHQLTFNDTQALADELCQRLSDQISGRAAPIGNVNSWLCALAKSAAKGIPLQNRGVVLAKRRRKNQAEVEHSVNAALHEEAQAAQRAALRNEVLALIKSMSEADLEMFIDTVCKAPFMSGRRSSVAKAAHAGLFPDSAIEAAEMTKIGMQWLAARHST